MKKTPEQITRENEEITNTSLDMMSELVETNKKILGVLEDIAAMIEEVMDQQDDDDTVET